MDKISIFKGKRVLVTGDTGFKGSWLCMWLKKLGAEVYGFALPPPYNKGDFHKCLLNKEIHHTYGDTRTDSVRYFIKTVKPEFIFHLAAQPIVLESFLNPSYTFETNIMGTVNVLDAARDVDCLKSIVVVTSDKCYRNTGKILTEDYPLGGDDPYSASKACEDLVASSFYKSFFKNDGVGLSTVRAGNVVGGGDRSENRIIPDCIKAIENGIDIEVRNPGHIRPWQYVLEPLHGYLKLAAFMYDEPEKYSSAWNFGPDSSSHIPVLELAEMILINAQTLYNKKGTVLNIAQWANTAKEKKVLTIDSSKSKELLGIRNILSMKDICRFIVEDYFCEGSTLDHRIKRIKQYEELVRNEM